MVANQAIATTRKGTRMTPQPMRRPPSSPRQVRMPRMRRELALIVGLISASLGLAGCQLKDSGDNVVNGKILFAENCGTCHVLERAGAKGTTGPNLDAAFRQSRVDGLGESTFQGVVLGQIMHPNRNPQLNPENPRETTLQMPANIVTGQDARDVAAYVAYAAGKPGK